MIKPLLALFALFALFVISACSSHKNAGVVYHESFDFSLVKSYSFYQRNSAFTETQSLIDTRRNAIEIAIERTMSEKNFDYAELKQADVIVTYHFHNGVSGEYSKYNEVVRFCVHCLRASTWQTKNQYSNLVEGSLILDLVDPKKKRSVWRSTYPLDINVKDNSAKLNDKIQQAVSLMLAQYPKSKS